LVSYSRDSGQKRIREHTDDNEKKCGEREDKVLAAKAGFDIENMPQRAVAAAPG
jgi:hypothetical protein